MNTQNVYHFQVAFDRDTHQLLTTLAKLPKVRRKLSSFTGRGYEVLSLCALAQLDAQSEAARSLQW
jgi:hypothetical protein